jgi:hypothetical protein
MRIAADSTFMRKPPETSALGRGCAAPTGWLTMLAALGVALFALSTAATPARAVVPAGQGAPFAPAEGAEEEWEEAGEEGEEEFEESECEEAAEELAEGEIGGEEREEICKAEAREWERALDAGILPEECVVRTFRPTALAFASHDLVQLTIDYTAYESTPATIAFELGGSRLATARLHLGYEGTVHLTRHLSDSQSARVRSAHRLSVQIAIPESATRCGRFFASDLTASHPSKEQTVFLPRRKRS